MRADILAKIRAAKWYHRFEVLPGVITPGRCAFDARATLDLLGVPRDLRGKRVLDVGTWDGPLAFEMEERGAEVYAIDVQNPDHTAFNTAKTVRNSKVKYIQASVYDLGKLFGEKTKFDLITYFGVYYHLKNPIGGFEALSRALAVGGVLCLEGEVLANYAETLNNEPNMLDNKALGESDVPLALCSPGWFKGVSNWFIPNVAGLKSWLVTAGLEMTFYDLDLAGQDGQFPRQRIIATARKSADLMVQAETCIFKKNLEMPADWLRQFAFLGIYLADHPPRIPAALSLPSSARREESGGLLKRVWRCLDFRTARRDVDAAPLEVPGTTLTDPEDRAGALRQLFQTYLHRDPDLPGLQFYDNLLAAGHTVEQITAMILGSWEYLQSAGGTPDGWLTAVYRDLFNRPVDPEGQALAERVSAGAAARLRVAAVLLNKARGSRIPTTPPSSARREEAGGPFRRIWRRLARAG